MSDVVNSIRSQNAGAQLDIFRAGKDLWSYGTLIKHFVKYTSKKLHKYILNRKLDSKMDTCIVILDASGIKYARVLNKV